MCRRKLIFPDTIEGKFAEAIRDHLLNAFDVIRLILSIIFFIIGFPTKIFNFSIFLNQMGCYFLNDITMQKSISIISVFLGSVLIIYTILSVKKRTKIVDDYYAKTIASTDDKKTKQCILPSDQIEENKKAIEKNLVSDNKNNNNICFLPLKEKKI